MKALILILALISGNALAGMVYSRPFETQITYHGYENVQNPELKVVVEWSGVAPFDRTYSCGYKLVTFTSDVKGKLQVPSLPKYSQCENTYRISLVAANSKTDYTLTRLGNVTGFLNAIHVYKISDSSVSFRLDLAQYSDKKIALASFAKARGSSAVSSSLSLVLKGQEDIVLKDRALVVMGFGASNVQSIELETKLFKKILPITTLASFKETFKVGEEAGTLVILE